MSLPGVGDPWDWTDAGLGAQCCPMDTHDTDSAGNLRPVCTCDDGCGCLCAGCSCGCGCGCTCGADEEDW